MTGWNAEGTASRPSKGVVALTLLALLLVAVVPVALLAGVVLMALGHVVVGLALFAGAILTPAVAIAIAGFSGLRRLRKLVSGLSLPLDGSQYADAADPGTSEYKDAVKLDPSEYSEVR